MRYRWDIGFWAWLLMRITGVLIVLFLMVHLLVLSRLGLGREAFESFVRLTDHPVMKLLELGLTGAVIYHALNGIRVCIMDFGWGLYAQKRLFWTAVAVGFVLFVAATIPIMSSL